MSFNLKASKGGSGGDREQPPAGNHPAVLVALVDCGTQHDEYQGKAKWRRQVLLVWELPTRKQSSGKSHTVEVTTSLALNERAKLRLWAEAVAGAKIAEGSEFDVTSLIGKPCLVNVIHNENKYARVQGVAGYPEGLPAPTPTIPPFVCSLDEFKAGKKLPDWLPWQWSKALTARVSVEDYIRACKEIAGDGAPTKSAEAKRPAPAVDDPIPF